MNNTPSRLLPRWWKKYWINFNELSLKVGMGVEVFAMTITYPKTDDKNKYAEFYEKTRLPQE